MKIITLSITLLLTACTTSIPMVALMGYDTFDKRKRWTEYANEGDIYAQFELGNSYCCRFYEGATNPKEAMRWWCEAARGGHAGSMMKLAEIYANTETYDQLTAPLDLPRALVYTTLAERRAHRDAFKMKAYLEETALPVQKKQAETMLATWRTVDCMPPGNGKDSEDNDDSN